MKKTAQTLLTAAIFATALGSSAPSQFRQQALAVGDPIKEVETNLVDVYGPPSMFTTDAPEETTATKKTRKTKTTETSTDTTTYTTTTEDIPEPLYGPPWVFYPTGDVTMDNLTDARDLTFIKRAAIEGRGAVGYMEYESADVNHDGVVDKEDVRIFREEVLGIPKKEEPAVTTTAPDTTAAVTTTTTNTDAAIISDLLPFTDTAIIALYGPPRTGDWDDLRWDDYDALFPGSHKTTTAPQDQTTKTETVEEINPQTEK